MTSLTDCERQSFATRWQKIIQLPLKFTAFPKQPMQPNTTRSEFIVRSRDGWRTVWTPRNGAGVCGRDSLNLRRWIRQWLLIHYLNWSDVSVRATVTLNAVVVNGMSLNVPMHVVNVKDSVKIATLMQAPVIQVNTNSYHELHNCL